MGRSAHRCRARRPSPCDRRLRFARSGEHRLRQPAVGQQNVINVTAAFFTNPTTGRTELTQRGTIPPTCAEARAKGGKPLEPEESLTFTVSVVTEREPFSFTADYYRIDVEGRLAQSATQTRPTPRRPLSATAAAFPPQISTTSATLPTASIRAPRAWTLWRASISRRSPRVSTRTRSLVTSARNIPSRRPWASRGASTTPAPTTASDRPNPPPARLIGGSAAPSPIADAELCGLRPAFSSVAPVAPPPGKRGAVA